MLASKTNYSWALQDTRANNNGMKGIYVIECDKYFYIGLSSRLKQRKAQHFTELNDNTHRNWKMQNVYNSGYRLQFKVLEECEIDLLEDREIYWFNRWSAENPEKEALNLKECGSRPTYSYEARERISKGKIIHSDRYDFKQRYIVINSTTDEFLYIGNILDISKTFDITLDRLLRVKETYVQSLDCSVNIIEELDNSVLDWISEENYFDGIL